MQESTSDRLLITPAEGDESGLRLAADALDASGAVVVRCDDGEETVLPESATEGLRRLLSYLAAGMAVAIKPYDDVLTTSEAAEVLGMSRPYLVHLMETGAIPIPVHKVGPGAGGHRRISLQDVVSYRDARNAEQSLATHPGDLAIEIDGETAQPSPVIHG